MIGLIITMINYYLEAFTGYSFIKNGEGLLYATIAEAALESLVIVTVTTFIYNSYDCDDE